MRITAHKWRGGWELRQNGDPITQVATLDKAVQQVRDYLDTIDPDTNHGDWHITITPEIGDLGEQVSASREATAAANAASNAAAEKSAATAQKLRAAGFSVTDTAAIFGVSRGRISQLLRKAKNGDLIDA